MPKRRDRRFAPSPFDVERSGRYVGTSFHYAGANWMCVGEAGPRVQLRRFQDEREVDALVSECSRPGWWEC